MEIILKKQFIKEVAKLPAKIQGSVKEIIDVLEKAESLQDINLDIKRMEGQQSNENYFRIRIGSYRMGLEVINPLIIVITILSRGDIYKKFPPR